jgi:uncharacterized protein
MQKTFLTAEWRDLIMANYLVDPILLQPYIPAGTELDDFNGSHYLSFVGFMFRDTRLLGFKIPFHINFEEINLRFYVKRLDSGVWKRGVVFIKEIVPKYAIKLIANTLYKEQYACMPMRNFKTQSAAGFHLAYHFKHNRRWNKIEADTADIEIPLNDTSLEHFIAEHYWGYAKYTANTTYEYEVIHPKWWMLKVNSYLIDCDFTSVYGQKFSFLSSPPDSVFVATGSPITILKKNIITTGPAS